MVFQPPSWTKVPADLKAWEAYRWSRFYLSWVRSDQDAQDLALLLAAMQSSGPWPITRWTQIERALKAAEGWLPPELLEVNR